MFYIIQFGSTKTPQIKECILNCGQQAEIFDWDIEHKKPKDLKGIIFSGSPTYLTEVSPEPYRKRIEKLFNWNVPILGICFGHQILGVLHGAKIYRGLPVRTQEKIILKEKNELFKNLGFSFKMMQDHTEGIDVPPSFFHLASSKSYPVEAIKHNEKPFWGIQFHPEVSEENGMILFENFISICKNYRP